jgi:RNA polymerase sigma-70 factor (ECF subfamily)
VPRDPLADPEPLIRQVYAYVAYRIGGGPDAEDITAEVFERALRYRGSYDRSKGEPRAWLVGIARRCIAEHAAQSTASFAELPEEAAAVDVEEETVRRVELRDALAELSDADRELIALRYGADLTARQIGELLETRTNTVEVSLHRALGRLRERLEGPPAHEATEPEARLARETREGGL